TLRRRMHFSVDIYIVYVYSVDIERICPMKRILILALTPLVGCAQVANPELTRQLTEASQSMSSMNFDSASSVSVHGRVGTLVWPEGASGMILIEADGKKYAFSTAKVP